MPNNPKTINPKLTGQAVLILIKVKLNINIRMLNTKAIIIKLHTLWIKQGLKKKKVKNMYRTSFENIVYSKTAAKSKMDSKTEIKGFTFAIDNEFSINVMRFTSSTIFWYCNLTSNHFRRSLNSRAKQI